MKPASDCSRSLDDLLSKVLDGALDDGEQETLTDLLRCDPQARRLYHNHIALHALLHWKETEGLVEAGEGHRSGVDVSAADHAPSAPFPVLGSLNTAWRGTVGYFADHDCALSYLIATVLLGIATFAAAQDWRIPGGTFLRRYRRGVFGFVCVGRKVVQRLMDPL